MRRPDLSATSNPVMVAARHFGIPSEASYLLADMILAHLGTGRNVWPKGHEWHGWAIELTDYFADKHFLGEVAA